MSKIKKISLITPPYHSGVVESAGTWLNLGFVTIAGALRKAGFEVDYYDAMALWHGEEEIEKRLLDFRPDVVATTAYTASIYAAMDVLTLAKQLNPQIYTVVGNVHATFCWEELLTLNKQLDFVVCGEGEHFFPRLLEALNAGENDSARLPGIAARQADGTPRKGPDAPFLENLDLLEPAWDLVEWQNYRYRPIKNSTLAVVSSSRGCQQQCSFCSQQLFWRKRWRGRSAENFVDELLHLRDSHGVNVVMLADEIPTLDRARWEQILDLLIERQAGIKLLMETRVDDILRDANMLDKYKSAGVEHIYVGVEAGRQAILDVFQKGTRVDQSKSAIELINQHDIVSETSFVLGMPDETPETVQAAVELAKEYNPDMAFFLAIAPWPYAEIYDKLKAHIASKDYAKYNLVEPVVKPAAMSLDEMRAALGKASRQFFMHKFKHLQKLSSAKQAFMLEVLELLINHSYLADHMQSMQGSQAMPHEVQAILDKLQEKESHRDDNLSPIP